MRIDKGIIICAVIGGLVGFFGMTSTMTYIKNLQRQVESRYNVGFAQGMSAGYNYGWTGGYQSGVKEAMSMATDAGVGYYTYDKDRTKKIFVFGPIGPVKPIGPIK